MKKICLIFLLFGTIVHLYSQKDFKPGYIITNDGDTIYGQIDYRGDVYNSEDCLFKSNDEQKELKYEPGQIKAYRLTDGKYYVSREVLIENKKRVVFLEFLVNGKADLYYLPGNYYFIENPEKGLHILENTEKIVVRNNDDKIKEGNEYIGIMSAYMNDCPSMYSKIIKSGLNQKDLIKVTTEYHNLTCPGEECIVYSKIQPKQIIKFGFAAGCNLNYMGIYDYLGKREAWEPGIMTGLQADFSNSGSRERFFISLGLFYSQIKHDFLIWGYDYSSDELDYNSKNLMLSATVNYIYPKYKLKPFIGFGVMYFHTLESSKVSLKGIEFNPKVNTVGTLLSLGFTHDLSQKISLKFMTQYNYGYFYIAEGRYYYATDQSLYSVLIDNINFLVSVQYKLGME